MSKIERMFTDGNLLRTFVEIAECRNLTQAASRLNRSQSAISVQLRRLEEELDATLFIRVGKGMALSNEGKTLLPTARRALAELSKVQSLFAAQLNGKIRVGIPDDFDEGVLERTLAEFAMSNPGVEVVASSGCTAEFPDALKNGDLDVAICSGPSGVFGEPLVRQKLVWAANTGLVLHPDADVPLAVINHGCWMGRLPTGTLARSRRSYRIAFECSGIMSLKAAIRAGFAVGILFETSMERSMKKLTERDGFPELPSAERTVAIGPHAPQELAAAMAGAIRKSV